MNVVLVLIMFSCFKIKNKFVLLIDTAVTLDIATINKFEIKKIFQIIINYLLAVVDVVNGTVVVGAPVVLGLCDVNIPLVVFGIVVVGCLVVSERKI